MRGWPHVVSERLIFNDSSVFLRKCAVLAAAPSKQGVGEAASSVPFPVQEKRGGGTCRNLSGTVVSPAGDGDG